MRNFKCEHCGKEFTEGNGKKLTWIDGKIAHYCNGCMCVDDALCENPIKPMVRKEVEVGTGLIKEAGTTFNKTIKCSECNRTIADNRYDYPVLGSPKEISLGAFEVNVYCIECADKLGVKRPGKIVTSSMYGICGDKK